MNFQIATPAAPHPDVSPSECRACGMVRDRRKPQYRPVKWTDGLALFQSVNRGNAERWYSRGPILHCMRTIALDRWYALHAYCHLRPEIAGESHSGEGQDGGEPDGDEDLHEWG